MLWVGPTACCRKEVEAGGPSWTPDHLDWACGCGPWNMPRTTGKINTRLNPSKPGSSAAEHRSVALVAPGRGRVADGRDARVAERWAGEASLDGSNSFLLLLVRHLLLLAMHLLLLASLLLLAWHLLITTSVLVTTSVAPVTTSVLVTTSVAPVTSSFLVQIASEVYSLPTRVRRGDVGHRAPMAHSKDPGRPSRRRSR